MQNGFSPFQVVRDGVRLHGRIGGKGAPLLLLHGHPQTLAIWRRVAPALATRFTLVMMDLRGYGDSDRPAADAAHLAYSKRGMAGDAMAVMRHHGFDRFQVLARDRGARVGHRLAAGLRLVQPLRVLWAEHGAVGRCFDVLGLWRERAERVSSAALACGHYIPEEASEALAEEALQFFA